MRGRGRSKRGERSAPVRGRGPRRRRDSQKKTWTSWHRRPNRGVSRACGTGADRTEARCRAGSRRTHAPSPRLASSGSAPHATVSDRQVVTRRKEEAFGRSDFESRSAAPDSSSTLLLVHPQNHMDAAKTRLLGPRGGGPRHPKLSNGGKKVSSTELSREPSAPFFSATPT
jgi:hypothetical protein